MKLKLDFIQKRMRLEKRNIIIILMVVLIFVGAFSIYSFWQYAGYIFGLKDLTSNEKVSRFYNSIFYRSNLHFDSMIDTGESIDIITTSQEVIYGPGGGGMPGLETKYTTSYNHGFSWKTNTP